MKTNLSGNNEMQNRWSDTFSTLDVYHGMQITNVKRWTCVWANRKLQKNETTTKIHLPFEIDMNHYSPLVDNSNCNLSTIQPLDAKKCAHDTDKGTDTEKKERNKKRIESLITWNIHNVPVARMSTSFELLRSTGR